VYVLNSNKHPHKDKRFLQFLETLSRRKSNCSLSLYVLIIYKVLCRLIFIILVYNIQYIKINKMFNIMRQRSSDTCTGIVKNVSVFRSF
jgi:hypothetical protein